MRAEPVERDGLAVENVCVFFIYALPSSQFCFPTDTEGADNGLVNMMLLRCERCIRFIRYCIMRVCTICVRKTFSENVTCVPLHSPKCLQCAQILLSAMQSRRCRVIRSLPEAVVAYVTAAVVAGS